MATYLMIVQNKEEDPPKEVKFFEMLGHKNQTKNQNDNIGDACFMDIGESI